jgi:hypothetical protein
LALPTARHPPAPGPVTRPTGQFLEGLKNGYRQMFTRAMERLGVDFQHQRRWSEWGPTRASPGSHQRLPSIFERLRFQTKDLGALLALGTLCLAPHESIALSTNSGGGLLIAHWPTSHGIFRQDVAPPFHHCCHHRRTTVPPLLPPPPGHLTRPQVPGPTPPRRH